MKSSSVLTKITNLLAVFTIVGCFSFEVVIKGNTLLMDKIRILRQLIPGLGSLIIQVVYFKFYYGIVFDDKDEHKILEKKKNE